jgi:hypothetical protein
MLLQHHSTIHAFFDGLARYLPAFIRAIFVIGFLTEMRNFLQPFARYNGSPLGSFLLRPPYCLYRARRFSYMPRSGSKYVGESGRTYRLISPLAGITRETAHVWKAVNDADETEQFVIKEPKSSDDPRMKYPEFQHEVEMQKLFKYSPMIRPMVDFIPAAEPDTPKMVLQGFEKTLWTARNRRIFSDNEIKWIMMGVLLGLWTVHRKGLVYSGRQSSAKLQVHTNMPET